LKGRCKNFKNLRRPFFKIFISAMFVQEMMNVEDVGVVWKLCATNFLRKLNHLSIKRVGCALVKSPKSIVLLQFGCLIAKFLKFWESSLTSHLIDKKWLLDKTNQAIFYLLLSRNRSEISRKYFHKVTFVFIDK